MQYYLELDEEASAAIEVLKDLFDVDSIQEVLSMCLGFVYQLMLLSAKHESVRKFLDALSKTFKLAYQENADTN